MFKQFVFFTPSFDVEALIDEKINKKRFFAKTDEVDDLIDGKIHLIWKYFLNATFEMSNYKRGQIQIDSRIISF